MHFYQAQLAASTYPDVLPVCVSPTYIQSGASICLDIFPAYTPPTYKCSWIKKKNMFMETKTCSLLFYMNNSLKHFKKYMSLGKRLWVKGIFDFWIS